MKYLPLLYLLSLSSYSSFAQGEEKTHKKLKFKAASLQFGVLHATQKYDPYQDFNELAPNSTLLKNDFSEFEYDGSTYSQNTGGAFSLSTFIAIDARNKKVSKLNPELRIGVSYNEIEILNSRLSRSSSYRVDTLVPNLYYVDSTSRESYFFSYTQDQLFIDLGLGISTKTKNRWKLFGGINGSVGVALNPIVDIFYIERTHFDTEQSALIGARYETPNPNFRSELHRNKARMVYMLSASLGADFLLTKKADALKQWHIFLESRPNVMFQTITETNSKTLFSNIVGLGVKCELGN